MAEAHTPTSCLPPSPLHPPHHFLLNHTVCVSIFSFLPPYSLTHSLIQSLTFKLCLPVCLPSPPLSLTMCLLPPTFRLCASQRISAQLSAPAPSLAHMKTYKHSSSPLQPHAQGSLHCLPFFVEPHAIFSADHMKNEMSP